jgi:hypothetical protein
MVKPVDSSEMIRDINIIHLSIVVVIDIEPQKFNGFHSSKGLVPNLSRFGNPLDAVSDHRDEVHWLGVIDTDSNKIRAVRVSFQDSSLDSAPSSGFMLLLDLLLDDMEWNTSSTLPTNTFNEDLVLVVVASLGKLG